MSVLKELLAHPLTRGMDIDAPGTTALRRRIVREKPFLRQLYQEWYRMIVSWLPAVDGEVLEIGSGAGFMEEHIPGLITSEIFETPGARIVLDGTRLPFAASTLRAIAMTDVFHHVPAPRRFLAEAQRCLKPGGRIVMIEPWVTRWSTFVYQRFHHEPFRPSSEAWEFPATGPLSGANGAIPWMVFQRDRAVFEREFPRLRLRHVEPLMPLSYLVSGGVSLRALSPGFSYGMWRTIESASPRLEHAFGMFALVVVEVEAAG